MMTFQLSNMIYQMAFVEKESDFSFVESYERDLAAIDHARFISCSLRITVSGVNNKEIWQEPYK